MARNPLRVSLSKAASRRTVAVTGASGGVGSRVIRALSKFDPSVTVVALARNPFRIADSEPETVRPEYADYEDVQSLVDSLAGSSALIFVSSDGDADTMLRHHRNVVSVLSSSVVQHVVYMSTIDIAAESPFYYAPIHRETEKLLRRTGIPCCFARTSIFADFFVAAFVKPCLEAGVVELPMINGAISFVTRDDVAESLALASVVEMTGELALTGPAALQRHEIECALRAAVAQSMSIRPIDEHSYRHHARQRRMTPWLIEAFCSMFRSVEQARFSEVSGDIRRLLGREPATFSSFLEST